MVIWTADLDRALFIAILNQNPGLKIDAEPIAKALGHELSKRAITERIGRLKKMLDHKDSSPSKPTITGKRIKGMTGVTSPSKTARFSNFDFLKEI